MCGGGAVAPGGGPLGWGGVESVFGFGGESRVSPAIVVVDNGFLNGDRIGIGER